MLQNFACFFSSGDFCVIIFIKLFQDIKQCESRSGLSFTMGLMGSILFSKWVGAGGLGSLELFPVSLATVLFTP